jgi:quercetin dioxygenase-like cupin family protein
MSAAAGFVVPTGGGRHFDSPTPGRSFAMKLLGRDTNDSIMIFEETLPPGTASLFHLHRDSDEVAWVLASEFTFLIGETVAAGGPGTCAFMPRAVPHACKNTGSKTGRVLFLYTPAAAGGLIEALSEHRPADDAERRRLYIATAGRSSGRTHFEADAARGRGDRGRVRRGVARMGGDAFGCARPWTEHGFAQEKDASRLCLHLQPVPSGAQ